MAKGAIDLEQVSPEIREITRNTWKSTTERLDEMTAKRVAEILRISQPTVSRIRNGELCDSIALLAAAGFKVVPVDSRQIKPEDIEPLLYYAKKYLESIKSVWQLPWDN